MTRTGSARTRSPSSTRTTWKQCGLVKFDFLGLRTLTILDWAVKAINQAPRTRGHPAGRIGAIPLDDAATYKDILSPTANTGAVFQLRISRHAAAC